MYFVAKEISSQICVVIPTTWVFAIEEYWERLVNKGINRNEKFLCFYSQEPCSLDDQGAPNLDYIPDWDAILRDDQQFPESGCYKMKILKCMGK